MTTRLSALLLCSLLLVGFSACFARPVPVPVGTIPEVRSVTPEEEQHGHRVLSTLTKKHELDYSHPRYQSVLDIVEKLTTSINANSEPWHVYLLKAPEIKNAAATRGNHIFVWTGMLDATKDDDELAAVIGHEIGHVLARHTDPDPNEALRRAIIEVAAAAAGVAVTVVTENPSLGENAGRLTSSVSRELGNAIAVYPYSRERELEADHIGLFLMAKAGYDPSAAVRFWERAMNDPKMSSNLSFFSTHPPAGQRLERLREILPMLTQTPHTAPRTVASTAGSSTAQPLRQTARPPTTTQAGSATSGYPRSKRDSFDVSAIIRSNQEFIEWRVLSDRAVVYTDAKTSSRALGEFRRGSLVLGTKRNNSWVRIESPDAGYIRVADLERTTN